MKSRSKKVQSNLLFYPGFRSTQAYPSASTKTFIKPRPCTGPVQITAHTLVGEKETVKFV